MVNLDKWKTNEDEPEFVTTCFICGANIYRYDEYYSDGDNDMCIDCYENFSHYGG